MDRSLFVLLIQEKTKANASETKASHLILLHRSVIRSDSEQYSEKQLRSLAVFLFNAPIFISHFSMQRGCNYLHRWLYT